MRLLVDVVRPTPGARLDRSRLGGADTFAPDTGDDPPRTRREGWAEGPPAPRRFEPPEEMTPPLGPGALRRAALLGPAFGALGPRPAFDRPGPDLDRAWLGPDFDGPELTRPELLPPRDRARCSSPAMDSGEATSSAHEMKTVRRKCRDMTTAHFSQTGRHRQIVARGMPLVKPRNSLKRHLLGRLMVSRFGVARWGPSRTRRQHEIMVRRPKLSKYAVLRLRFFGQGSSSRASLSPGRSGIVCWRARHGGDGARLAHLVVEHRGGEQ